MQLAVLNPGGRDPAIDYAGGPGTPSAAVHPPVNYHAFAAATRGSLHDAIEQVLDLPEARPVLLLIRRRIGRSIRAARHLKSAGRTVLVTWKEAGRGQVPGQLGRFGARRRYSQLLDMVDGIVHCASYIEEHPSSIPSATIPTPYPLEFDAWDFSVPVEERVGVFIGTRQFRVASRHHEEAIRRGAAVSERASQPMTVMNTEGALGRRHLDRVCASLTNVSVNIVNGPLPYHEYACVMARHRIVLQCDRSGVPGQVAGDALLCRSVCVGGDGLIESIAFPAWAGEGVRNDEGIARLLTDDVFYADAVAGSQRMARERLSFEAGASELDAFVRRVRRLSGD